MSAWWLAAIVTVPLGLDQLIPAPAENPLEPGRVKRGRELFFDKRLSRDGTVACATCHDPARGFADGAARAVGIGGQVGPRRSPRIVNRAYGKTFFWDGRAATLEEQVVQPIANPVEMGMRVEDAAARVGLTREELVRSLASYVRTILAGDSPYDRFIAGDRGALTAEQQAGLKLFRGKANCVACHLGPNLTDEEFHATGPVGADPGRFEVTRREGDRGAFKTPSLRQVAETPPYLHDGSKASLEEVVEFYDQGKGSDPEIRPLGLTAEEKRQLVALLRAFTGRVQEGWP
ncbi:MAG: cytochrome-c peroxidase [Acidobacteria bacterium]|nr:cytochrome-c peroxidase [Acidobacteriota bacterium]